MQLASQSTFVIWAYYNVLVFGWNELEIGLSVALFGIMLVVMQGVVTGKVIARIGPAKTIMLGFLLSLPANFIFAFAFEGWHMIAGILVGASGGMTFPAMQQIMSSRVAEDAQGELQGAVASTMSITSIIGPLIMTNTFSTFADDEGLYFPGAPYFLAAMLALVAVSIAAWNLSRDRVNVAALKTG